jgi:hypothetical protein
MAKYKFGDIIAYDRNLVGMVIRPERYQMPIGGTVYEWQQYVVLVLRAVSLKQGSIHNVHWTTDEDKKWRA